MFLENIQISQFRNIGQAFLEFSPGFNIFYGDNGQGKSNLLEALYMLAYLKGFRGAHIQELIAQGASGAQLAATLNREGAQTRLGIELSGKQRKVQLDREPCGRLSDYLGILRAILFVPGDVSLLQSAPAERRTFLDRMVFNLRPSYLVDLDIYTKTLRMKSAELRNEQPNESMLDVYDQTLCERGCNIICARYWFFETLAPYLTASFSSIFDDQATCYPQYMPANGPTRVFEPGITPTLDAMLDNFRRKLFTSRQQEIARQQASSGPHRDDWTLIFNRREGRYYASQGQQRAMILSLKMAEIECIKRETNIEPIFLLDDISSELDATRNDRLTQHLYSLTTQAFLTTTSKSHFRLPTNGGKIFRVQNGAFYPEEI